MGTESPVDVGMLRACAAMSSGPPKVRKQDVATCLFVWPNTFWPFARVFTRQPMVEYRYREYLNVDAPPVKCIIH